MATRTISTKLAIEGESEYRASLTRINSEIKTLQSALRLTESQYQTNANSMEALTAKGKALSDLYTAQKSKITSLKEALDNARSAEAKYREEKEKLTAKIEANKQALEKLKSSTSDTAAEEKRLTEENKELAKQLEVCDTHITATEKGVNSWQTQLNTAQIKLNDLDAEIKLNGEYLAEAEKSSDHCATSIDRFGERVQGAASKADELATALADAGVIQAVGNLTDGLKECIDEAVKFEAEMAAVSRTTGITNDATGDAVITLDELADELRQMSTEIPIATSELAAIATTAGQLGIAQGNVVGFTEVMAKLGTTTDLTADEAATMLAQFANITRLDPSNYDRLGSTVAALGDATATTASKIVNMSQGIAAIGSICGMSETDILAISAAVGSVGVEAGAGSTAVNQFLQSIQKAVQNGGDDLAEFASVAGMTAGEFKVAWTNNAAEAFAAVISGLGEMGDESINELDKLGVTAARQQKIIQSLAQSGDNLTTCLELAGAAWDDNMALTDKAATMYGTAQAQIDIMNNKVSLLKESIGAAFAPTIAEAAEKAGDFALALAEFAEEHPQVVQAVGAVVTALAGLTTGLAAFQAAKKAANILELGTLFGKISSAATSAVTAVEGLAVAVGGSLATGLGLIAGMAAPVVAGIYAIVDSIKESKEVGFLGDGKTLQEYQDNVDAYTRKIGELEEQYKALADCGADLTGIGYELDMAHIGLAHANEELAAATEAAASAADDLVEAEEGVTDATGEADGAVENIKLKLDDLAQAYLDAYEAAGQSIEGQLGLFGQFKATLAEDVDEADELLARWGEQTEALGQYTENLQWAAQSGLDDGLVASLADGSAESAAYLALIRDEVEKSETTIDELGNETNEGIEKFNAAWEGTKQAREILQETMAGVQIDLENALADLEQQAAAVDFQGFHEAVDEAFANVGIDFHTIGTNIGDGLSSGIDDSAGDVSGAATDMMSDMTDDAKSEVGVNSPSTVFHEIGENIDAGLEQGIEDNAGDVVAAVTDMADALIAETREKIRELKSVLDRETSSMPGSTYTTGRQIIDGMINGMNSRSGVLYWTMTSIVNTAIARAKSAAAVASPSKKTTEIFEYVGEGMIIGIENQRRALAETMQSIVDNALDVDVKNNIADKMASINDHDATAAYISSADSRAVATGPVNNITHNVSITVNGAEGQDVKELADYVMARIQDETAVEEAIWR